MSKMFIQIFLFLFSTTISLSQIKINEYSVSNATVGVSGPTFIDNQGNTPDWIELYNPTSSGFNIAGYNLTDNPINISKYTFPIGTIIPANGFLRVWCSGKGTPANSGGNIHTNFSLSQCKGDWIVLSLAASVVDSLQIRKTQATHSRGRVPDGAANWKVFTAPTPNATNAGTSYIGYAPTPLFSLPAGFYPATQIVTILALPSTSISIYYTLNGSEPTTASTLYNSLSPISITVNTVLRAITVTTSTLNILPSFMETNTYFIGESINSQYGVVSISGGAPLTTLLGGTQNKPRTHFEYFEDNLFVTETYGLSNKHGNDSWAYQQRGIDFETKDDYGYNNALKATFFSDWKQGLSTRNEFPHVMLKAAASDNFPGDKPAKACHMRDAFVQTYAFRKGLELDGRRNKHVLTFVNGQYWGIYELREPFSEDYTDHYYKQPGDSIDNLAFWGGLQIRNGSDTGWVNLYNFVMANSMTNLANYNYVNSKLSFSSIIDYMIYNSYVVNSDFVNWNSAWWRGRATQGSKKKWRYWMWDMDNVYDLGENFSGIPTTGMNADPCAYETVFTGAGPNQGHPDIIKKLMTNPDFKSLYINRYADLLNTAFKCDSIMDHFNHFKNILTPEMPRHIAKWGSVSNNLAKWNKNMDSLQSKIQQRCSYIEQAIVGCYGVTGPFPITVDVDPPGAGEVKLNTIWLPTYIWKGNYFGNVTLTFKENVIDTAKYQFDYWEFVNHTSSPNTKNDSVSILLTTSENVIAHYIEKSSDVIFPSGFTPNGDGKNDLLIPLGARYIKSLSIEVWNRWGQLVYSSIDPTKGWDGYFNGVEAQTGVYAYLIKYTNLKDEVKTSKGNVTLLR
jgi:gliding motility-associated-like protein